MTNTYRCSNCGDTIHASMSLDACSICGTVDGYDQVDNTDQITVIKTGAEIRAEREAE